MKPRPLMLLALSAWLFSLASAANGTKKAARARRSAGVVTPNGCRNVEWHDIDGDDCEVYAENQWCTLNGKPGTGWDETWGTLSEFQANGFTALTACCACGGGSVGGSSSARYTYAGCTCKKDWRMDDMICSHTCCNPDDDPVGKWCMVESEMCEDADWGYCRPTGAGNTVPTYGTGEQHGDCKDFADWEDLDGEGCDSYAANAYCTDVGGYGLGWNEEWGSFAAYATAMGSSAQACCACGGGQRGAAQQEGTTAVEDPNKVRVTWTGCTCKKGWQEEGVGKCDSYCCNPDRDPDGPWCKVVDPKCEDADWGYCMSSGLGTVARPMQDAAHCADVFLWRDKDGDGCNTYVFSAWCSAIGESGSGWHEEWGTIQSFTHAGHSALSACCGCGGGVRRSEPEANTFQSLANLFNPTDMFMWKVVQGPCKMDEEDGCVTSGNFPKAYSPNERCQIAVDPANARPIHVAKFVTEQTFDALQVNGVIYSGKRGPSGVVPTQTIYWGTDAQNQKRGWKLCPRGANEANPAVKALKVIAVAAAVLLLVCCFAVVCLTVKSGYTTLPTEDGPDEDPAGASKIGKPQEA